MNTIKERTIKKNGFPVRVFEDGTILRLVSHFHKDANGTHVTYGPEWTEPKYSGAGKYKEYRSVGIYGKFYYVHKLVAEAFLEDIYTNPDGTPIVGDREINHKDGNTNNNHYTNLEYCDRKYNNTHRKWGSYAGRKMRSSMYQANDIWKTWDIIDDDIENILELLR